VYSLSRSLLVSAAIAALGAVVAGVFVRTHHAEEDAAADEAEPVLEAA